MAPRYSKPDDGLARTAPRPHWWALERAKSRLLPEVDIRTTVLMLRVVIARPLLFGVPGVCETTLVESDRMLAAILLFREEKA